MNDVVTRNCQHKGMRHAQTKVVSPVRARRMEWCTDCGKLLDDREWPIPLPVDDRAMMPLRGNQT